MNDKLYPTPTDTVPLVVDLDGTLIRTDSFLEGILAFLGKPQLFGQVLKTEMTLPGLKHLVEPAILGEAAFFPFNENVLEYIQKAHKDGRKIYLATAGAENIAASIAARTGIFSGVFASSKTENLKGKAKCAKLCDTFGAGKFDYIGNSLDDVPVWACADRAIVASGSRKVIGAAGKVNKNVLALPSKRAHLPDYIKALRVRQWVKNILVFLPMLLAHNFSWPPILASLMAFFSLGFAASAIYIVNDLCDLTHDRKHPIKKNRPFASGVIPIAQAPALFGACLLCAFAAVPLLPWSFLYILLAYLGCSIMYSLIFKKFLFIDVITLAVLYVLRIMAGAAATGGILSNWLIGFAGFIFLGLALFKRYGASVMHEGNEKVTGRAYIGSDNSILENMAITSGFCSVVIVALYIDSLQASKLYHYPGCLWLICPLLVYWYGRLAIKVHRGLAGDDPVNFVVQDKVSWLVFLCLGIILYLAI